MMLVRHGGLGSVGLAAAHRDPSADRALSAESRILRAVPTARRSCRADLPAFSGDTEH